MSVALLEHHNGTFAKVLIPPCNTRSGPRVSINHDYKGTRDAVTATSRRTEVSFGVRPKPIYFWNTKPLSPNGARERCVWAELCRDDSYYTGFAAAKQGLPPELTLPASLAKFTPPHSWPGTPSSVSDASSWSSTTSPTNYSTSPDGDYSQPRLARSPMSKTTRTTKEGPIIARSS